MHCLAALVSIQQIGHVYQHRGVREFLFMQHRVVCLCLTMAINRTHTVYFTWHEKGDIADIVRHRQGQVATTRFTHLWSSYFRGVYVRSQQGCGGGFPHLDGLVLMNILIISPIARTC